MYRIGEAACAAALLFGVGTLLVGQAPPAPMTDRVGFPSGYSSTFNKMLTFDRPDNGQIRVVWANDIAAGTPFWEPSPMVPCCCSRHGTPSATPLAR